MFPRQKSYTKIIVISLIILSFVVAQFPWFDDGTKGHLFFTSNLYSIHSFLFFVFLIVNLSILDKYYYLIVLVDLLYVLILNILVYNFVSGINAVVNQNYYLWMSLTILAAIIAVLSYLFYRKKGKNLSE